jgi:beta-lactamase class D
VAFLRRLYRNRLPFDRRNVEIVKRVLVQEEKAGVFSGKTGSCEAGGEKLCRRAESREREQPQPS